MTGHTIHKTPKRGRQIVSQHNFRKTFMIFTEGQTEEGYFKKFKVRCKTITSGNALRICSDKSTLSYSLFKYLALKRKSVFCLKLAIKPDF